MKSSQNSLFILEEQHIYEIQNQSLQSFRSLNRKPVYVIQFKINQQSDQVAGRKQSSKTRNKKIQAQNIKLLEKKSLKKYKSREEIQSLELCIKNSYRKSKKNF
ncbi:unnamed protein product [Paramecium sonneborni]|uniref:Uncharacterized protein n=1 Tax=Paramecium sonneborni TaxID=65129 RepID=A0A8S1PV13_9CILI|nr:unnamed protein product [Paramecium sonneborni]